MTQLLEFQKIFGPIVDPCHLFPRSETYYITIQIESEVQEIVIECSNPDGESHVSKLDQILINNEILHISEYENLGKKLQSFKIIILPLIQMFRKMSVPKAGETWQHVKTSRLYYMEKMATLQSKFPDSDMEECMVYVAFDQREDPNARRWVRPLKDFVDDNGEGQQRFVQKI